MSTLVTIAGTDLPTNSRANINDNFSALNNEKIETSVLDVDSTLAANSDAKICSQKAVKAYVDAAGGQTYLVPTGAILPYGASTAPTNFLLCDGSAVSRSTYATLLAVIGTTYGVGNGSTTFNLPNLQGRFPLGYAASAPTKVLTFASRASNVITITGIDSHANNELQTGQAIYYDTTGTVITGLTDATTYYVVRVSATTFSLATSVDLANGGTVITLSGDGTGTQTFTVTYTARPLGQLGGTETDTQVASHHHTLPGSVPISGAVDYGWSSASQRTYINYTNPIGSNTPNNMPLFTVVNYIIKT
jgi:microcystin-dependent protein